MGIEMQWENLSNMGSLPFFRFIFFIDTFYANQYNYKCQAGRLNYKTPDGALANGEMEAAGLLSIVGSW